MLTEKEKAVLRFIQREKTEHEITPSTREIQRHIGFASQTSRDAVRRQTGARWILEDKRWESAIISAHGKGEASDHRMSIIKPRPMPEFPRKSALQLKQERKRERKERRRFQRIKTASPTKKLEDEIYREKRRAFLAKHPFCQVRVKPDGEIAPRYSQHPICGEPSGEVHHVRGRGRWYLDEKYWLATGNSFTCPHHAWITSHGNRAEELGYKEDPLKINA